MTLEGICFEISVDCPKCRQPLPLNRVAKSVLCQSCRQPLETPVSFWQSVLGDAISEGLGLPEGEGGTSTMFMGDRKVSAVHGHLGPRCSDCKRPFANEDLAAGIAGSATSIACHGCGKDYLQRKPPEWFSEIHELVVLLVAEQDGSETVARMEGSEGIPFHCYHCGGSLPLDPGHRQVDCRYCGNRLTVPDEIWVRVNPVPTTSRWYAVVELGEGGALPGSSDDFCSMRCLPDGDLVFLFHADRRGEAGHPCRLLRTRLPGQVKWLQDGIEFADSSRLLVGGDGSLWIFDRDRRSLRRIDPENGEPLATLEGQGVDDDPSILNLQYAEVAAMADGTLLVHRDRQPLRRFAGDGRRLPLWGEAPSVARRALGWFMGAEDHADAPRFEDLRDRPQRLPDDVFLRTTPDGRLFVLDEKLRHVAVFAPDGALSSNATIASANLVESVSDCVVDAEGVLHVLFDHAVRLRDTDYPHVARIRGDGSMHVVLGPHTENPSFIGAYSRHLAVGAQGNLFVGSDFDRLRQISGEGVIVWRSPGTLANERHELEDLAENRKGKRIARDRS